MEVRFIRHYKLAEPFDKRETITEEQYTQLSKGEIDPSINEDIKVHLKTMPSIKYELILCSPTNRTKETTVAINSFYKTDVPIVETPLLKECVWNPKLEGSRIQRFIEGTELTTLEDTWIRIEKLENYLKTLDKASVLCVTHSFLMQILYLYFSRKVTSFKEVKYEDIKGSYHGDYLDGFSITIDKSSH